ncbi:glycosyltransferase family 4 protein [Variovorax sp. J22G73]|uniref:glycosyltransferase family 4 protein n=1 Tax=unclassified Variovorax TaxID=663243 RepID=UPI00257917D2|nr:MULTISPECIES: glycosyltransferase family 4 protein [unclassified Variovorax]MDM0004455.1 glycosyltransferase family 4 protein [Variovorax sp. J22R203]MDM0095879.1 glycosyltransferase family 4 protein [Variovorax sp. J22G73]
MKILILTTKFTHVDGSPWLISELADELCAQGHQVTVLNIDWEKSSSDLGKKILLSPGLNLISIGAFQICGGAIGRLLKWLVSSLLAMPFLFKEFISGRRYDLLIGLSPCSALWAALPFAALISRFRFLIYWDFFPVHNLEIFSAVPVAVKNIAKVLERWLIGRFGHVGLMSERGVGFFKTYFNFLPQKSGEALPCPLILPIWTSVLSVQPCRESMRSFFSFESDRILFVFGGQITYGRGVRELCEAAVAAYQIDNRVALIICGGGSMSGAVAEYALKNPECIKYLGSLPREKYLKVLAAANVGVVATVPGVSAPAYPSKSLDYMACGIPIMAAVEDATDFGEIVERNGFGVACRAGDTESMKNCILSLSANLDDHHLMGCRGKKFLAFHHSVFHASSIITGVVRD